MHDCQKFREDWIAATAERSVDCVECRRFCDEADTILLAAAAASPPVPELSEEYWNGFEDRLHDTLTRENAARSYRAYGKWSALAAAAAIAVVVSLGSFHPVKPVEPQVHYVDDHIQGLDPKVVTFLGHSELFLRNFTKIEPSYKQDLEDSQTDARQTLMEIAEKKKLAGDFAPVRITLDEYENVLREIKNLDSNEELAELQRRIRANGLIANMHAFQPQVMLVSSR